MTPRYRCPWCDYFLEGADRFLNHLFGFHVALIKERLAAMPVTYGTRNPARRPPEALKPHPCLNPGVSGEGDS